MEAAWLALAEEQDWLDGEPLPVDPNAGLIEFLRKLFDLAEAVHHQQHFVAGFDGLVGRDVASFDFADLGIPSGYKLTHKLLLGQTIGGGRENHH
jgi:hypothetical protein